MQRPSFQFYPGDWRGTKWITYDPTLAVAIPAKPGCYVVYVQGHVVYIGQSTDVRKRLQNYNCRIGYGNEVTTPWGEYDLREVKVKIRFGDKLGDWAMREIRLITRLQPEMNCLGSRRKRGKK